ncbi:carbon-nitrogen hydrolase-like protein [Trichoderma reesei QM6a]|uniref:Carbon-nitrogen hydrolase-like protein n=1 Tax=Hypocrea jecorina (strain QM6a) TaxID=431241 RepID=G0RW75_HYPJQ|nr:carbon-nitrogen hydrolase-like protein [Trichoderma reesei QM6a]EGR44619.1 carbon-nitrogen hydrolase-like protein [Trichoderma reesei QM6a]
MPSPFIPSLTPHLPPLSRNKYLNNSSFSSAMTIRVGTASPNTQPTTPLTLSLLHSLASRAAAQRIDILLLPEAFIGGYPRGSAFGCVVGSRTAEGREAYARYFDQAIDLGDTVGDGSAGAGLKWVRRELPGYEQGGSGRGDGSREELERIARDTGVFYVTGCIEKAGGSLYCAAVYVCPKEGIIGKRRKVMPTGSERLIWAQGHPSTLRAVSTFIRGQRINLAAAICWENYMPLLRQSLYAQNINLYLAPTADSREGWLSLMRTVGIEGRCFVVSSNMCVRADEANGPAVSAPKAPVFLSRGGSSIVSPFGDVLAGPQWEDEDNLIYADIDLRDCIRGRLDLDTAGSYSRNDAFKLTVDGLDLDPLPY